MLLAIDSGNSNIVFAVIDKGKIALQFRLATNTTQTSDQYAIQISLILSNKNIPISKIKKIVIASVVPEMDTILFQAFREFFGMPASHLYIAKNLDIPMKINVNNPREVGIDRLINSFAAINKYKTDAIILDFGTATTFDVAFKEMSYEGGVICPGINLSLRALRDYTAKLPAVSFRKSENIIGKNTIDAMISGSYFGYLGMIEKIVERIKMEYKNRKFLVISTGGLSEVFAEEAKSIDLIDSNLTIDGINMISNKL